MLPQKAEESLFEQTLNKVKKWAMVISERRSFQWEEPASTKAKGGDVSGEQIPGLHSWKMVSKKEAGSN